MPAKKRAKKTKPGNPDRTGMISEKLSKAEVDKRGRTLAKEERKLLKAKAKKKSTVTVMNEEIRGLESGIEELSEQVDTGCEWVKSQQRIPGA